MELPNRRKFIQTAAGAAAIPLANNMLTLDNEKYGVAHQVYFWLKNPDSETDKAKLIEGLNTLSRIKAVKKLIVGTVAGTTKRDVIDTSWSVSELTLFENVAGEAEYQSDPIHLAFVRNYSHLWSKVQIYDSAIV